MELISLRDNAITVKNSNKEHKDKRFGEVEITLVCDRSGSMQGVKFVEQRKAAVLIMEVLKEFTESCNEEQNDMDLSLEIRSEIYLFQSSEEDAVPLKKMSKKLGEKDRVDIATMLSSATEGTTDFVSLEAIQQSLKEEVK